MVNQFRLFAWDMCSNIIKKFFAALLEANSMWVMYLHDMVICQSYCSYVYFDLNCVCIEKNKYDLIKKINLSHLSTCQNRASEEGL